MTMFFSGTSPRPYLENRFKFVSRKPFFRLTTTQREPATTAKNHDQASEPSNQQSLEEDFDDGKTTELVDIAEALRNIQKAPYPSRDSVRTTKVIFPKTHQRISGKGQQQIAILTTVTTQTGKNNLDRASYTRWTNNATKWNSWIVIGFRKKSFNQQL